jgi:hypothetical protein
MTFMSFLHFTPRDFGIDFGLPDFGKGGAD